MLLRRVTNHVQNQNWFAVFIDFIIVVIGVFIGIQVANWSAIQNDKKDFAQAIVRLNQEIADNLRTINTVEPKSKSRNDDVNTAISAMLICENNNETMEKINLGLNRLRGTTGLHLRTDALEELTNSPRLLALQNNKLRGRLKDMAFAFDLMRKDARFSELQPLEANFIENPIISVGELISHIDKYHDINYTKPVRKLYINSSVNEACENERLLKSLNTWHLWQSNIPVYTRQTRAELNLTMELLETL